MPAKLTRPENSFNNIYMRYYKKSFLFVKSYIHNEMVAEDIASESLIKLWQWIQDNPVENIEPMLLSILRNKALDYLRHESMKQQVITRISEKQNEELALRLSSLEDCNPNEIFSKEVMDIVKKFMTKYQIEPYNEHCNHYLNKPPVYLLSADLEIKQIGKLPAN